MARYRPPFVFTDEQFYDAVQKGMSVNEMARVFGVNRSSIYKRIRRRNVSPQKKEPLFNENIFDAIDTEEKAYWLGFLYADGSVTNKYKRHVVEISLKEDDIVHLLKFNDFIGLDKKLHRVKVADAKCGDVVCRRCRIIVSSKHLCDTLEKYGCVPKKSLILQFPNLSIFQSEQLVYDFIRGYIDGDGSIRLVGKNVCTIYLSVLGTKEFLTGMLDVLKSPSDSYHIYHQHENNTYTLVWKTKESRRIADLIYGNASISLDRKYGKYEFAVFYSNMRDNYRAKTVKAETR